MMMTEEQDLPTCFNDDHKSAVVLQTAVEELDSVAEVVHIVDHLSEE